MEINNAAASLCCMALWACLLPASLQAQTPDPGITGPLEVATVSYNLGDEAFDPPSFPDAVEVRANVIYPAELDGPYPVLLFLHGRHSSCYNPATNATNIDWPCSGSFTAIPSFEGYDYLGEHFASLGYIVISISANSISSTDNFVGDYGMQARGELLQHHLDLWNSWNTTDTGPFGSTFIGQLDLSRIGTMGHSRGGEGVIHHALLNQSLGSPYGIQAVITLAPVDFNREVLKHIPFLNIAPYCDGDVSDLQGVHFYDDVRYLDPDDEAAKYSLLMLGSNHNFYNTVWTPGLFPAGAADDWVYVDWGQNDSHCGTDNPGNQRLTAAQQRSALLAYSSAFFRYYVGGESDFAPILEVTDIEPPASANVTEQDVFVSFHPGNRYKINLNTTETESAETINNQGAAVSSSGLAAYDICGDDAAEQYCLGVGTSQEPHCKNGSLFQLGLAQLGIEWNNNTNYWQNNLPDYLQDLSQFDYLQARVAVNFETTGGVQNFSVVLADAAGNTDTLQANAYTNALFYPPGDWGSTLPRIMHNTLRIPLLDFSEVDITQILYIQFIFDQTPTGGIFISDLLLSSDNFVYLPPIANLTASATTSCTGTIQFFDASSNYPESWLWDFGDGATSTLPDPTHTYSSNGLYTVSLTVSNPSGTDTETLVGYVLIERPDAPTTASDTICAGETATLNATSLEGGTLHWYTTAGTSEPPVHTGESWSVEPFITTTWYVTESIEAPLLSVGPPDNTFGSGGYFDGNDLRGIFFDVLQELTLEQVTVYAGSSGTRTIQVLAGEGGPVVHSLDVDIEAGEQTINLGFLLLPGSQYYLKVTGDLVDLFRINDGSPEYPYVLDDIVALTGSNVDGDELEYYYFFFDWKVRTGNCVSEPAAVTAVVNPLPVVATIGSLTINEGEEVSLFAAGGVSYLWEPSTGLDNPFSATPMASPTETTTYVVTVTTAQGCSDTASVTVTVLKDIAISQLHNNAVKVFPNPFHQNITIQTDQPAFMRLYNPLGAVVHQENLTVGTNILSLPALSPGYYQLVVQGKTLLAVTGLVKEPLP